MFFILRITGAFT